MKTDRPKVLHEVCGRPMVSYVIDAAREAGCRRVVLVVGHEHEQVREGLADAGVEFVLQAKQKGTGHAVTVCREAVGDHDGSVLILGGDGPLVRAETLGRLIELQREKHAALVLGTAVLADPTGYGRIVRDDKGRIAKIVEQKDANRKQRRINEINPSCYVCDRRALFGALDRVRPNNAQAEYYLTDCVSILLKQKKKKQAVARGVWAEPCVAPDEAMGINDRAQLAEIIALKQQQIQEHWMAEGVTIVDPRATYIDVRATIGRETTILPFTTISGAVTIGQRCRIGPSAHLRDGAVLEDDVTVGAFVEVVRSRLGRGTQAMHLAYLGDAEVGAGANVGAGAIVANFDGRDKHRTQIGADARLGAGTILVAPVSVGPGGATGAGAVVLKGRDVRAGGVVVGVPARELRRADAGDPGNAAS